MREIIFDTETTGLDSSADRIIEIGAVELENRFLTGRSFHVFINPEGREVHPEALAVHGIGNDQLLDKPKFREIMQEWMDFTAGATLIAHNASFDVGFLNAEFARVGFPPIDPSFVIDSLHLARRRHPMGPNSLDALCKRYGIDNSRREKHGALLDSELLAEVYIELVGGKQATLSLETTDRSPTGVSSSSVEKSGPIEYGPRPTPLQPRLTAAEVAAHRVMVAGLGDGAFWIWGNKKGG
ncbi:DNA polymerase III subunit epsilon [Oricola cellulosilytica]|uniref:DNA polymerase III subunit epsilon n=1 Tax=Oricola cellulosilytica TaxID=1429082 RepID=A0A4R0PFT1_9HYPH|nr:DNA polymerase III subunit epsilon [Oricola cellulosilytica]TCD16707.1 DNA polymerase III subunit epsilon [Oricola cellulosilytica]